MKRFRLREYILKNEWRISMEGYNQPIIRLAQVSDAKKLKDINDLFNGEDETTFNEVETSLRENKDEIIVCADIGTSFVGVCYISIIKTVGFNWQYCFITEIFVQKEYRNRGIGTLLMEFVEKELTKRSIRKAFLWTGVSHKTAQKLCMSFGYDEMIETKMFDKEI